MRFIQKMKCFLGFHQWQEWTGQCNQRRICGCCPKSKIRKKNHDWGAWEEYNEYENRRVCRRCGGVDIQLTEAGEQSKFSYL